MFCVWLQVSCRSPPRMDFGCGPVPYVLSCFPVLWSMVSPPLTSVTPTFISLPLNPPYCTCFESRCMRLNSHLIGNWLWEWYDYGLLFCLYSIRREKLARDLVLVKIWAVIFPLGWSSFLWLLILREIESQRNTTLRSPEQNRQNRMISNWYSMRFLNTAC